MAKREAAIEYDYTRMTSGAVGAAHGIAAAELKGFAGAARAAARSIAEQRKAGGLAFMGLHERTDEARAIRKWADRAASRFDNFVVLGIGGSALGAIALQTALNPPHYNLMPKSARGNRPRLFVEDNVDPDRFANLLEVLDPAKTLFNVITKSGGTAETMAGFLVARDFIAKKIGEKKVREHFVATTDASQGNLRKIVEREGLESFVVPDGVGGRFSVLSVVGLLPAVVAGMDVLGLLRGAASMAARCASDDVSRNPALMAAALQYLACMKKGKTIQVMMPYSNRLRDMADWYRQLWAESLGKKTGRDGRAVHAGQTPIKALGATDQHSQLQLYNEGPNDKTVTFLRVESFDKKVRIPGAYRDIDGIAYLSGRTMQELINAECAATELALTASHRPNSRITVPSVNAHAIGQLIFMFEMQTAYAGEMFDVNAFDQPGVEQGKIATYALMGRPGYEKQAETIRNKSGRLKPLKM